MAPFPVSYRRRDATLGALGLLPTGSMATPPAWEVAFARHALHAAAARRAPQVRNPIAATDSVLRAGMKAYPGMFAWDGQERDEKVWTIVTFLRRLDSLPPSIAADWRSPRQ
jgi:hypothetical protein